MDDQRLSITIRIAPVGMAVVPVRAVLVHGEVVGKRLPWEDGTLGGHRRAVHVVRAVLVQAMPVDRGVLVAQSIVHVHDQTISLLNLDNRQRPLSIDANDLAIVQAIWVRSGPCHVPVVSDGFGLAALEGQQGSKADDEPG